MFRIYGKNSAEITDKELGSGFNEWAENKQFILGDEITGGDKRHSADRMKSMITQKQLRLNVKFVPSYVVPDCINYFFTSNHPDAFFLEDTDRRFFIHEVKGSPYGSEFYDEYFKWLDGSGKNKLFHYLLSVDLTGFNPAAPAPMTASKRDMIDNGRSDIGTWAATLRDYPEAVLRVGERELHYKLWTTTDLHNLYDGEGKGRTTVNGMARELSRAGFEKVYRGGPVQTDAGPQKLWLIRPIPGHEQMTGTELSKIYLDERGLKCSRTTKL